MTSIIECAQSVLENAGGGLGSACHGDDSSKHHEKWSQCKELCKVLIQCAQQHHKKPCAEAAQPKQAAGADTGHEVGAGEKTAATESPTLDDKHAPAKPKPSPVCNKKLACRELGVLFAERRLCSVSQLFLQLPKSPDCCLIPNKLFKVIVESRKAADHFFKETLCNLHLPFHPKFVFAQVLNPKLDFTLASCIRKGKRECGDCCDSVSWATYIYADFNCEIALAYGFWLLNDKCRPCDPCGRPHRKSKKCKPTPPPCGPCGTAVDASRAQSAESPSAAGEEDSDSDSDEQDGTVRQRALEIVGQEETFGDADGDTEEAGSARSAGRKPPCHQRILLVKTQCPFWRAPFLEECPEINNCLAVDIPLSVLECSTKKVGDVKLNISFTKKCDEKKVTVTLRGILDLPGRKKLVCVDC